MTDIEEFDGYKPMVASILRYLKEYHPRGVYRADLVLGKELILIVERGPGFTKRLVPEPIAKINIVSGHLIPESFDERLLPQNKLEALVKAEPKPL